MHIRERMDFFMAYRWMFGGNLISSTAAYRREKANKSDYISILIACHRANAKRRLWGE